MASSVPIVTMSPPSPEMYDKERNITWDEIAPSLQALFTNTGNKIMTQVRSISDSTHGIRITIGPKAPNSPAKDREIWIDTSERTINSQKARDPILRFYMDRNNGNNPAWEITKAAWYGGVTEDVKYPSIPNPTKVWSSVGALAWVSQPAKNNSWDSKSDLLKDQYYTIPSNGTYYLRDISNLFEYNQQLTYTHDGGAFRVAIMMNDKVVLDNNYDSKSRYASDLNGTFPEMKINCVEGDVISLHVTVNRNPQSTDDLEIYMSTCCKIFKLNSGSGDTKPEVDEARPSNWHDAILSKPSASGSTACHCHKS